MRTDFDGINEIDEMENRENELMTNGEAFSFCRVLLIW
jgi:hypothetical protein